MRIPEILNIFGEKKQSTVEQVSAQPMPKAEVMVPVLPNQAVSRNSRRILSNTILLLRMRYSTFVAHIILFLKLIKRGLHLYHDCAVINP
jgi:hypothetical protein